MTISAVAGSNLSGNQQSSGIIFINRNGLRWRNAPREYGQPKTLYNRWKRWGDMGVFARMKFLMTAGQTSDHTGAAALLDSLPAAEWMIADRGYDADWFREALKDKRIRPRIPGRKSRSKAVPYDKRRYPRHNRIEIMFGSLKDWRRVATRYDRCAETFLSALAATAIFWL
ncbi:transposase [Paracoccus lutimaris]|nr:transposase [Paracoccus lutimaris]